MWRWITRSASDDISTHSVTKRTSTVRRASRGAPTVSPNAAGIFCGLCGMESPNAPVLESCSKASGQDSFSARKLKYWKHKYNDQDVLNIYCEDRVRFLDMSWNLLTDCDHTRISHVISYAPEEIQKAYFAARNDPKIIHYAGYRKPWQKPTEDIADYFWSAMRCTPFYETALYNMSSFSAEEMYKSKSLFWRAGRMMKRFIQGRRKPNAI